MKHTVKYDDASWHHEGDFPSDLPDDAAGTHIGMFLAWAVEAGLLSQQLAEEGAADVAVVKARQMTGREFLYRALDGKLIDEDLSDVGNTFVRTYYRPDGAPYLLDYYDTLADGLPSIYHAADTWENFERLRPVLDRRFGDWLRDHRSGD